MLALVAVLAALPAAPADAAPETSPGVRLVTTIPERGVISARLIGQHLYVSSLSGVTVFDISNPRAPVRVGRVDLPNAQNEDVDAGSGILLVSDDPFGGRGILHVIDVHDPANPRLLSTYGTWARGLLNFNAPPPRRGGIGHTATCIQQCRYAWLAGSSAGIEIVDLGPAHRAAPGASPRARLPGWSGRTTCRSTAPGSRGWRAATGRPPTTSPTPFTHGSSSARTAADRAGR